MYSLSVSTVLLTITILVGGEMVDDVSFVQAESRLRKDLLRDYNRELLPRINRSDIVNITYSLFLKRLEPNKNFKVSVYGTFMFSWKDEFLAYEDKNPHKIKSFRVMTDEIWVSAGTEVDLGIFRSNRSIKPCRFLTLRFSTWRGLHRY
jgi:Neurotransmitter-gated ion-channel ligand binding domain